LDECLFSLEFNEGGLDYQSQKVVEEFEEYYLKLKNLTCYFNEELVPGIDNVVYFTGDIIDYPSQILLVPNQTLAHVGDKNTSLYTNPELDLIKPCISVDVSQNKSTFGYVLYEITGTVPYCCANSGYLAFNPNTYDNTVACATNGSYIANGVIAYYHDLSFPCFYNCRLLNPNIVYNQTSCTTFQNVTVNVNVVVYDDAEVEVEEIENNGQDKDHHDDGQDKDHHDDGQDNKDDDDLQQLEQEIFENDDQFKAYSVTQTGFNSGIIAACVGAAIIAAAVVAIAMKTKKRGVSFQPLLNEEENNTP